MDAICTDNRFEVIAAYKRKLIDSTNIETSHDEMAVLDSILFRFWQMGWLKDNKTNADRIRSMTDEELAEFFFKDTFRAYMKTPKENLDWLKQEATE